MHTTRIIRNEIFNSKYKFDGSFDHDIVKGSVPKILLTLVNMLLEGPGNLDSQDNKAAESISQLIVFNAVKTHRKWKSANVQQKAPEVRHPISQETPLPIYLGLMLHALTRKTKLIDKCFNLGLCISYDRVLKLSNKVSNTVCTYFNAEQTVCPPGLRSGLFTVAAGDNIDHNLSSTTAQSSFHGTAVSLMQFPAVDNLGTDRGIQSYSESASDKVSGVVLPQSYTARMYDDLLF
jgi:hypothetical protein